MALELVGGAVLGAAVGELLKAVIDAKQRASSFQPSLTRLESTLTSIIPRLDEISRLNHLLNHLQQREMEELVAILHNGMSLVLKCSKISALNLIIKKGQYSKELRDLDNDLLRYFMTILPLDHFKATKEILVVVKELQMKLVGGTPEKEDIGHTAIGKFRPSIKSWQKGDFLRSGSFGTVYEGYTNDGLFFAVKEVSLLDQGSLGRESIYQLEQEISLLSQFEHENIVQYFGSDKDEARLYIFLELLTKGSLASVYQKYTLGDYQVSAFTRQILNGLKYLHERNVVHRDIKCANILIDASGSVKLADFGLAKVTKSNDINSRKGTAFWMAPEVVNRTKNGYGLAADIWSVGCTVLEMLTRQIPYSHLDMMQALLRIGMGELPRVPDSLSRDAQDFIYKCLQVNPDDRPTAGQLLKHSFVKRPLQPNSSSASP